MNKDFQKINEEQVLFFDCEMVRRSKELEVDSEEYTLYQKKTRNRDTDEFLTDEELIAHYNKWAALKMGYNKIVTIGVGFIKDGVPYIKDISGEEKDVIKQFCDIANQFDYVCGANIQAFDLPVLLNNGWRYYNMTEKIKDSFITNGKRPWNLSKTLDLMEQFKGTHYSNSFVEEICYHFGIPTPKDDISGAQVSQTYYYGDKERIYKYVKKDVLANINIFKKMRGQDIFEDFVDRGDKKIEDNRTVLEKIYQEDNLTEEYKEEIEKLIGKKKLTKKEKENLKDILLSVYQQKGDKKAIKLEKEEEVKQFINNL